ncbi:helix-turn-helix domain-containing protein [Anaeromyxobacter sp. SG17]|uniref:helix-turn-helix domain-containing protein n=1 Tax=Anaeromyxobacter sp. SG17 TaxID=2925405 RepID=UPI001F597FA0|nr:helix-turn-helix transcriptional regulator [Anaeromyxobacter sp. SG17]
MGAVEKRLGRRVADQRKRAGLTQAELAERIGVTTETVSRLERGAVVPSLARLEEVALALGAELSDLFRVADRESQKDRAMTRLLAVVRRGSAADIEAVADVAERILGHFRR